MAESQDNEPDEKDEKVETRIPTSLKRKAQDKAASRGWRLSSVIRALLELWVQEDVVSGEDVGRAERRNSRTPKGRKPKK